MLVYFIGPDLLVTQFLLVGSDTCSLYWFPQFGCPATHVWHGNNQLLWPQAALCSWGQCQGELQEGCGLVLDCGWQLHTGGDGQTTPVCHGLLTASTSWIQRSQPSVHHHGFSHSWEATHCAHVVSIPESVALHGCVIHLLINTLVPYKKELFAP